MVNSEILKAFIWNISLYSHSPNDISKHDELIRTARLFVGIDIHILREGIYQEDVLQLILCDIEGQINKCDWSGVASNLRCFDNLAQHINVPTKLLFDRFYYEAENYRRRGINEKALLCTNKAETFADSHRLKFKILFLRGDIESSNQNRYEFAINSLSSALYEAEQLGESYVVQVYNKMARMCSMRYVALGMYFLHKAQVMSERLNDKSLMLDNKFSRINSYAMLAMCYPNEEKLFLDEARKILTSISYDKLPLLQNKMYYKESYGRIYYDIESLKEAYTFYEGINALDDICRICDTILEIGINHHKEAQAFPFINIYRRAVIERNRHDLQGNLQFIQQAEEIINGVLGK